MKIVRYFLVGFVATVVDIGIFIVGVKALGLYWFFVALCSSVLATTVNYLLSINYVFITGVSFTKKIEISLVFLVSGMGLVINQSILWLLIVEMGLEEVLSKLLSTGFVFFWNYIIRSRFIFKNPQ